eukprot:1875048-Amphidinium_carterae.1
MLTKLRPIEDHAFQSSLHPDVYRNGLADECLGLFLFDFGQAYFWELYKGGEAAWADICGYQRE